jgi:hypothetical protein
MIVIISTKASVKVANDATQNCASVRCMSRLTYILLLVAPDGHS